MVNSAFYQVFSVSIDGKTTGSTVIDTTENGNRQFYPMFATIEITAGTLITIAGIVSIGTNASSYNNILAATTLTGLTSMNSMMNSSMLATTVQTSVAPNTGIRVNVTTGFTATIATLKVMVHGYYH